MKTNIFSTTIFAAALAVTTFVSCDSDVFDVNGDPFKGTTYVVGDSIKSPIGVYLESEPDFSEYVKALRYSGTFNSLNQCSSGAAFTALVPNNEAMREFYQRRGVDSLENLTPEYMRQFMLYHTIPDSTISADKFVTRDTMTNLAGEILSITIDSVNAGQALIDNEAQVVEMGIEAYNGKIYVLSRALTPLVETVYDRLLESGTSSIMCEAIQASGWDKDLKTLADTVTESGRNNITKRYYTFLNVPDAVFAQAGINSLSDLRTKISERNDREGLSADSLLREYVSYHILNSLTPVSALGDADGDEISTKLLQTMATNQTIMLAIDPTAADISSKYTFNYLDEAATLDVASCDVRAKNGYVQTISSWLPVWEPEQTEVIWDLADYAEVRSIVEKAGKTYQPSSPVSSEEIIRADNATCYTVSMSETSNSSYGSVSYVTSKEYKLYEDLAGQYSTAYNNDRVVFNLGYLGSVEMQTPTLVRGKYRVTLAIGYVTALKFMTTQTDGSNGGLMKISFDGRDDASVYTTPYPKVTTSYKAGGVITVDLMDEVEFTETSAHTFKMIVMDPAASTNSKSCIHIDYIRFTPIE